MNFDDLPLIASFEKVELGQRVYSPKYGLGRVLELYRTDELIVRFPSRKIRINLDESDLRFIPVVITRREKSRNYSRSSCPSSKADLQYDIGGEYVSIAKVAKIFGIGKKNLVELCEQSRVKIFTKKDIMKITKSDVLELRSKVWPSR